jgi:polyferredoxin
LRRTDQKTTHYGSSHFNAAEAVDDLLLVYPRERAWCGYLMPFYFWDDEFFSNEMGTATKHEQKIYENR